MSATKLDIKTITEFLAEQPDVDVSRAWERCWGIHAGIVERVKARFAVEKHPSTAGSEYYTSLDGGMEGSFNAWSGPRVEWLVHSWLGNRKASLLDMNATVFLSQQNRVPHLVIIFGTVPKLFFYADYTPRVDLRTDLAYVQKYYEPANADAASSTAGSAGSTKRTLRRCPSRNGSRSSSTTTMCARPVTAPTP